MKYIFVGQNVLGGLTLTELLRSDIIPLFVVTKKIDRYPNLVAEIASGHSVPIKTSSNINKEEELIKKLKDSEADVIFCSAWGNIIKEPLLSIPKIGWVNFHPSYLPEYRGSSPISWQLINGVEYGGCTAHFMAPRFDEGNIVVQERIKIDFSDNSGTLREKCGKVLGELAVRSYEILLDNPQFKGVKQDEAKASYFPPRDNHKVINWNQKAVDVFNLIRGLSPYPCAVFRHEEKDFRVSEVEITKTRSDRDSVGKVRTENSKLLVGTADFFVRILSLRISDKIMADYAKEFEMSGNQ